MKRILLMIYFLVFCSVNAEAMLWDRGGGLIYDDSLNITWLQDANYAKTSGYSDNGGMKWTESIAWADQLIYINYSGWRLPSIAEFNYIYYEELNNPFLFGSYGWNPTDEWSSLINIGPFFNVQLDASAWYWTNEEHGPPQEPTIEAYSVSWLYGIMANNSSNNNYYYAWAVRDGDVSPVPEPSTLFLIGFGLIGVIHNRRIIR